jgi:hypothetical protein
VPGARSDCLRFRHSAGELHREVADAAGRACDQRTLPFREHAAVEECLPGGDTSNRDRRRLLVGEAGRFLCDLAGIGRRELRVAAARRPAEHLFALRETIGTRDLNGPRHVAAQHNRQLNLGHAPPLLPVDRVHRRSADSDEHLTVGRLGPLHLLVLQDVGASGLTNHNGVHGCSSPDGRQEHRV